jgi:hypothetical protein
MVYGMNTKLTLRMDVEVVHLAKTEARRRGKSVSRMVGEFFGSLAEGSTPKAALPPITTSLVGLLQNSHIAEADYRKHLREKYS